MQSGAHAGSQPPPDPRSAPAAQAGAEAQTVHAATAAAAPTPSRNGHLQTALRALRSRNYRLFFVGQGISLIGTWMQRIALQWLVYRLTGSALLLGAVGFAGQIPAIILSPVAGVLADRWNVRRSVVVTQVLALLQALILAVLTLTGRINVWEIVALSLAMGAINAFDMPLRQAFVVEMVDRPDDLGNAIALNSFLVNGARLIGPSLAGVLIATIGEGHCFLLNALSYIFVIGALLMMRLARRSRSAHAGWGAHLREGLSYAFGFPPIRAILLLLSLSALTGMSYSTLMPIFAGDILGGGPQTLGWLLAAAGVGALMSAVYLASRRTVLGLGRVIVFGSGVFGLSLVAFATSHALWLSLLMMLFTGMGMMLQMAASNTVLQTIVDDDKRGRVMSLYTTAFLGMTPFGSLIAGGLAHWIGAPAALAIGGGCCVIGTTLFAAALPTLRKHVHPIYARKGILPEVSTGLQAASEFPDQTRP